ncbi:hypothetical protein DCW30_02940 [Streptomyces alfalfae]|uniref:Integral membrane protein n=1 Tax=Streptomyces alfalfae TaxID=1642299 RepID=A0A1P8TAP5_9ACTN|nr:hypothetical protein [Streptomyces alfalfae]AYA15001.1 hypothetical protein D3X13_00845 [Streptomyces fradiae]APY84693.1 hypothetical protein A7J05_02005 [Streptomyces alfalfae]QQC93192.1 hypothetical protein I8755_36315 [Streptomyces alfalfae]QUI35502.1 hypothetical protein H9W91_35280 [Streptomyces alfalfae]RXX47122.1 hypothetical protein DCW30_02940 [Streptomyces alfalfae]
MTSSRAPDATRRQRRKRPSPWLRLLPGVSPERRGFILAWWGFALTFGGMRLLTWLIHIDVAGVGDMQAGGVHIHHYVWGIVLLAAVGAAGLVDRTPRTRAWMGLAYGVGLALIVDEAALLISLEDVYWDTEGGVSIALAIAVIAVAGSVLAMTRGRRASRRESAT